MLILNNKILLFKQLNVYQKLYGDTIQQPPTCRCTKIAYTPSRPTDINVGIINKKYGKQVFS